jgi:homocysteine S-methyltransferase
MITILDGGMGGEIQRRQPKAAHGLWSATALVENPELVTQIHREFIDAGANIITTNTYSTIPSYLAKANLAERTVELTALAAGLARQAADAGNDSIRVAGSLPPLSESYRADLVPDSAESSPIYREMVEAMEESVDLFLCETMSSAEEAHCAASQALTYGRDKPVYVSWSLNEHPGSGLRSLESVTHAHQRLLDLDIAGYLFNCTHPEAIHAALEELGSLTESPMGGYPNRMNVVAEGWTLDNEIETGIRSELSIERYVDAMLGCIEAGASIVGGCCGIGPEYIRALSHRLKTSPNT